MVGHALQIVGIAPGSMAPAIAACSSDVAG
jgi:hypothetical protein